MGTYQCPITGSRVSIGYVYCKILIFESLLRCTLPWKTSPRLENPHIPCSLSWIVMLLCILCLCHQSVDPKVWDRCDQEKYLVLKVFAAWIYGWINRIQLLSPKGHSQALLDKNGNTLTSLSCLSQLFLLQLISEKSQARQFTKPLVVPWLDLYSILRWQLIAFILNMYPLSMHPSPTKKLYYGPKYSILFFRSLQHLKWPAMNVART